MTFSTPSCPYVPFPYRNGRPNPTAFAPRHKAVRSQQGQRSSARTLQDILPGQSIKRPDRLTLDHIGPPPHPTIDIHLHLIKHGRIRLPQLIQHVDRSRRAVQHIKGKPRQAGSSRDMNGGRTSQAIDHRGWRGRQRRRRTRQRLRRPRRIGRL